VNKKRILIVDDEVGAARLLKANLEQTNQYEVVIENWPEDAVDVARRFKPDLVLLDIIMPRLPGGDLAARIEADPALAGTPVVFLTAAVYRHQVEEHNGIICDHPCLAKPASVFEIIQVIETQLAGRSGASSVPPLQQPIA
jgi:CheY-like chemotaxis protein